MSAAARGLNLATWCSGIGAPEQAVAGLGWTHHSVAEIEAFPSAVLAHRLPGVPNLNDITAPDFVDRFLAIGIPEVIVAGTPCQAFSVAGLRNGLSDERGNLTLLALSHLEEISNAARHAGRPEPAFLWENVPGALSDRTNAFGCLLAGLVGHDAPIEAPAKRSWPNAGLVDGPRRRAAWRILDAQFFGLAQRRARVFLVGCPIDGPDPAEILFERQGLLRHPPTRRRSSEDPARPAASRPVGSGAAGVTEFLPQSSRVYMPDGVAPALQTTGTNMGQRAPQVLAGTLPAKDKSAATGTLQDAAAGLLIPEIVAFGGNNCSSAIDVAPALLAQPGAGYKMDFESETLIAHTLRGEGFDASEDGTGRGTPLVPVWDPPMAFHGSQDPDVSGDVTHPVGRNQGMETCVAFQDRFRGDDGRGYSRAPPAMADMVGTLETVKPWNVAVEQAQAWAVRRLTPTECERLQGFYDGYTLIPYRAGESADGPRYKALGNSMAVPVMRWILTRLASTWPAS